MLSPSAPERPARPADAELRRRVEAWLRDERGHRRVHEPSPGRTVVEERTGGRFEYRHDARGDLVEIVEADGAVTRFAYDPQRRLAAVRRAVGCTRYRYDADGRLMEVDDRGVAHRYRYDEHGRLAAVNRRSGGCAFTYDAAGRVVEARTATVTTRHAYDAEGRIVGVRQVVDGVAIEARLRFDPDGRLAELWLPGGGPPVAYAWDAAARPGQVRIADRVLASYAYDDDTRTATVRLLGGVVERTDADPLDGRPLRRTVMRGDELLLARAYRYDEAGRLADDGTRRYGYDPLGRLATVDEPATGASWRYAYDARDNRTAADGPTGEQRCEYDADNRLGTIASGARRARVEHDALGRCTHVAAPGGGWTYRYDDAGDLRAVLRRGTVIARLEYDHKGRLAVLRSTGGVERYLYGADDELLAVTDEAGRPRRLIVRTPFGPLAEVRGPLGSDDVAILHLDHQGTCHVATDDRGAVLARIAYDPYGLPAGPDALVARFGGREWHAGLQLYRVGARWYDARTGRFLTPDTFTAAPDDERIVHPLVAGDAQPAVRTAVLGAWLQRPRVRNPYAYCGNDPPNRADPSGHWSFGGVLLSLLGAIWTLPNTLIGLILEITCLVGEVVRWLVWLFSFGHVSWETPGFDVAASGRLNAFALVFSGGWLGSFPGLLGITFGNVFFVYGGWRQDARVSGPGDVYPPAYGGQPLPKNHALYEHELRHTNQYGWFGPFFHLGLPIWGVYLWDVILNGYSRSWLERDAQAHDGLPWPA